MRAIPGLKRNLLGTHFENRLRAQQDEDSGVRAEAIALALCHIIEGDLYVETSPPSRDARELRFFITDQRP